MYKSKLFNLLLTYFLKKYLFGIYVIFNHFEQIAILATNFENTILLLKTTSP